MTKSRILILAVFVLSALFCTATNPFYTNKDSVPNRIIHLAGIDFRPAYVFPTNVFFKGDNLAGKPIRTNLSGHLKYGFKFAPETFLGQIYPHAVQGIGIAFNTFYNRSELGNPMAVYVFQTSRLATLTSKLSLDYEWNFGASFGWKTYDETINPKNRAIGSKINAYINLGMLICWQLNRNTQIKAGINVTHFSNGNTVYPNAGVNTVGGSLGIVRSFSSEIQEKADIAHHNTFKPFVSYDLIFYGATRKKGVTLCDQTHALAPGSYGIAGFQFNPLYNFNHYFRAGISLDAQYDESANINSHIVNNESDLDSENIRFYRPSFSEQFSVGISARAEIVMPVFSVNFGIGHNVFGKGSDKNSFYQMIALKTDITRYLFLHVGYQLYKFKEPNNLMLGFGIRLNAPKR